MFDKDYELTGKHAGIIKFFVNDVRLFQKYIDVYNIASLFGLMYGAKCTEKDYENSDTAKIPASAFINNRSDCMLVYRLVMLLDESSGLDVQQRIDRAFRDDAEGNRDKTESNMALFNSYVRGGLERMKDEFLDGCSSEDDYLRRAWQRFEEFKRKVSGVSLEDSLDEALRL